MDDVIFIKSVFNFTCFNIFNCFGNISCNSSTFRAEADAGVAVNTGAAIAREIADITIEAEDLGELLVLRDISKALMRRIDGDYRVIISLNSMLILLGAFGIITPATSAMMHNLSTIGISLYNMTDLIEADRHQNSEMK